MFYLFPHLTRYTTWTEHSPLLLRENRSACECVYVSVCVSVCISVKDGDEHECMDECSEADCSDHTDS